MANGDQLSRDELAALMEIRQDLSVLRVEYGERLKAIERHLEQLNGRTQSTELQVHRHESELSVLRTRQKQLVHDAEQWEDKMHRLERALWIVALILPLASVCGGAIVKALQIAGLM